MFAFPGSIQKSQWAGQGELTGGLIPYLGGGALGLCFGISTVWVCLDCPFDCKSQIVAKKKDIVSVQSSMHDLSDKDFILNTLASAAQGAKLESPSVETHFSTGTASHVILEILMDAESRHHIVSFLYAGAPKETQDSSGSGGHAIGVAAGDEFLLLDPNYGIGKYSSRSALCGDLQALLESYVGPTGHLTDSYLVSFDHEGFGDFVSAKA